MINTVIFDMDGLLIDSEPLWYEAALEVMNAYGLDMDEKTYATTVGLRTKEFLEHWFSIYGLQFVSLSEAENEITRRVITKVCKRGKAMPGVHEVITLFKEKGLRMGLATSSPSALIDVVIKQFGLSGTFEATASAEHLPYGKPHPQVYLDCAGQLGVKAVECLCLEDSFNGMLSAKSARMRCVVVPAAESFHLPHWAAADACIPSLSDLNQELLDRLLQL
jgi:mannitol-1-/sugar-/sorbitol-6-/2-deoxyglucose-6-phosphatase